MDTTQLLTGSGEGESSLGNALVGLEPDVHGAGIGGWEGSPEFELVHGPTNGIGGGGGSPHGEPILRARSRVLYEEIVDENLDSVAGHGMLLEKQKD